jgi:hypothetical protein
VKSGTIARVCNQDVRCSRLPYKGAATYYPIIATKRQEPKGSRKLWPCQTNLKSLPIAPSSVRPVLFFPPSSKQEGQKESLPLMAGCRLSGWLIRTDERRLGGVLLSRTTGSSPPGPAYFRHGVPYPANAGKSHSAGMAHTLPPFNVRWAESPRAAAQSLADASITADEVYVMSRDERGRPKSSRSPR